MTTDIRSLYLSNLRFRTSKYREKKLDNLQICFETRKPYQGSLAVMQGSAQAHLMQDRQDDDPRVEIKFH